MPISQRASHRMRRQVVLQPFHLLRSRVATSHVPAFAVKHDHMPGSQLITVVATFRIAGRSPEIIKIRSSSHGMELMIARRWSRAGLHSTPRSFVTLKILSASIRVCEIADCHHRPRNLLQQPGRSLCPGKILAIRNISRSHQDGSVQLSSRCGLAVARRHTDQSHQAKHAYRS